MKPQVNETPDVPALGVLMADVRTAAATKAKANHAPRSRVTPTDEGDPGACEISDAQQPRPPPKPDPEPSAGITLITRRRVSDMTGLQRTAIYERMARGSFPKPVRIGSAAVRWIEAEVQQWIQEQVDASRSSEATRAQDGQKATTRKAKHHAETA